MKKIVALTGAGISAESGLKTFRDSGGLWEGYNVMEVASPEGWNSNREKVLDFYNQRRSQLKTVHPNNAHEVLAELESQHEVQIVTQNVDNLHERAGSTNVLHLHGELNKVRSVQDESLIYHWENDLKIGDTCELGFQLRPHIVWFGEAVPLLQKAAEIVSQADVVIIIGTSLQVYPAAGLISYTDNAEIFYIDPNPQISYELNHFKHRIIAKKAVEGMSDFLRIFNNKNQ